MGYESRPGNRKGTPMKLREWLQGERTLVLDGAQGTQLQGFLARGEAPERLNRDNPDAVRAVHAAYRSAGSDLIYTNTFGANARKLSADLDLRETVSEAVRLARSAAGEGCVLLDVGPIGELLAPMGDLSYAEATAIFEEVMRCGKDAGCDGVAIETMSDLNEVSAALRAAKKCGLDAMATMSFEANGRTYTGCDAACFARSARRMGALAVGANCSLGPDLLLPVAERILANTDLDVIIKANAGLPDSEGHYGVTPEDFARDYEAFLKQGVRLIGGCCGTTPEHIRRLRQLADTVARGTHAGPTDRKICSASRLLDAEEPVRATILSVSGCDLSDYADAALDCMDEEPEAIFWQVPDGFAREQGAEAVRQIQSVCPLPVVFGGRGEGLAGALDAYIGCPGICGADPEIGAEEGAVPCSVRKD